MSEALWFILYKIYTMMYINTVNYLKFEDGGPSGETRKIANLYPWLMFYKDSKSATRIANFCLDIPSFGICGESSPYYLSCLLLKR